MKLMPETRGGALWRFLLAAVLIVLFAASATAVAGLLQVKQLAQDLGHGKALPNTQITIANAGAPQTLLLIGSDHRYGTSTRTSNTDTMMLVRLDASSSTINVLSVPRDLKVLLPQGGVAGYGKLNSAYSIGGTGLLVKTMKAQVFPGLVVNHIIDVDFGGFKALVNAVGCVYTDVDRRYFHVSQPFPPSENWSSIDVQPGYVKLCGDDALAFVRFRHFDSDIVRNARQQDFLRWAKSQFSSSMLISDRDHLTSLFGEHATTDKDLRTTDGLLKLFDLVAFSAGHTVRQITFPAILHQCPPDCYVTADPAAERAAYHQFMTPTIPKPAAAPRTGGAPGHGGHRAGGPPRAPVTDDLPDGQAQAQALGHIAMPVLVPGKIAAGTHYCVAGTCEDGPAGDDSYPRNYAIVDQHGVSHPAYRLTLVMNQTLGQFYGVEGTTWQNPPILNGPHETRMVNGKQLLIYFNGHKTTMVAWHAPGGLYWVSNTLTDDLSGAQMIDIAASLRPA